MNMKVIFKVTLQIQDTSTCYFITWKKKKSKNKDGHKFYQGPKWEKSKNKDGHKFYQGPKWVYSGSL